MKKNFDFPFLLAILMALSLGACNSTTQKKVATSPQPIYTDIPFEQDYSIKYAVDEGLTTSSAFTDRNGVVKVLSSEGLLRTHDGQFLYPGTLIKDRTYRPLSDKEIAGLTIYQDQFILLDDKAVLSNAWAGKLYLQHDLPNAHILAPGENFHFMISDGTQLELLSEDRALWSGKLTDDTVLQIRYMPSEKSFYVLGKTSISRFDTKNNAFETRRFNQPMIAFDFFEDRMIVATEEGYLKINTATMEVIEGPVTRLPVSDLTWVEAVGNHLWLGSTAGAFKLKNDGTFDYYFGKRWLPGNNVKHISKGPDNSVLVLTDKGLGKIVFDNMTLYDKAQYFESQVRDRHIRYGFNATLTDLDKGNIDSGRLSDSDNDGLWTTMYLAGQAFRYKVTKSEEALQNCRESMEAMERLFSINSVPGFPSRSFDRSGYINKLHDPERWQKSDDPEWDWKATTSSDEAIGHIFAYGVLAEIMDNDLKQRAVTLIDTLMGHVLKNDLYLVDYDGKPTTWGKWNPDYVNARPTMVGDRKINSSNIIGMLQTAYHFTGKEKYKDKAFDLMENHGYLENLMRPMAEIGKAPEEADDWSKMLSESWNHSDDEMYYVGYWGLYRYAFNDSLKSKFKEAIIDHWQAERPEKEGLWNIMTALTGTDTFDLEEAMWYLREHPLDLITWDIKNSHRKDIDFIEPNFREQTLSEVLPPDERPVQRHNANMFRLDREGKDGREEYSAGDIWLLPYWMGRYLEIISAPTPLK